MKILTIAISIGIPSAFVFLVCCIGGRMAEEEWEKILKEKASEEKDQTVL